jgi:hypothetical protein
MSSMQDLTVSSPVNYAQNPVPIIVKRNAGDARRRKSIVYRVRERKFQHNALHPDDC